MQQILIPILTFSAVAAIGGAAILARADRRHRLRLRLEEFGPMGSLDAEAAAPVSPFKWLEQLGTMVSPSGASSALRQNLAHAGYFSPAAAPIYLAVRVLFAAAGMIAAAGVVSFFFDLSFPVKLMFIVGGGWALSLAPSLFVDTRRRRRSTEIQMHLPDAVDMLEICVSSGMGLDMAWNAVSDEIRRVSNILADEMALTNLEIHLGAGRAEAMRHMARRTGSDDLSALVSTLVQSERFGTAVSDALRTFAESMREARMARASESAEKMGVKMLFPMIAFILPAILIVMGGGAVIKIIEMFRAL